MSWTGDWADWAGDNPVEAEKELHKGSEAHKRGLTPSGIDAEDPEQELCQHTEVYSTGHCADCGEPVPDFEPTDAQIFARYGQTKTTGEAAA